MEEGVDCKIPERLKELLHERHKLFLQFFSKNCLEASLLNCCGLEVALRLHDCCQHVHRFGEKIHPCFHVKKNHHCCHLDSNYYLNPSIFKKRKSQFSSVIRPNNGQVVVQNTGEVYKDQYITDLFNIFI